MSIDIRFAETLEDFHWLEELQHQVWGDDLIVPLPMLTVVALIVLTRLLSLMRHYDILILQRTLPFLPVLHGIRIQILAITLAQQQKRSDRLHSFPI